MVKATEIHRQLYPPIRISIRFTIRIRASASATDHVASAADATVPAIRKMIEIQTKPLFKKQPKTGERWYAIVRPG
jgi:hypothetical protein